MKIASNFLVLNKEKNFNLTVDEFNRVVGNNDVLSNQYERGRLNTLISLSKDGYWVYKYLGMSGGRDSDLLYFVDYVFAKVTGVFRGYSYAKLVMVAISERYNGVKVELYFKEEETIFLYFSWVNNGGLVYIGNSSSYGRKNHFPKYDIADLEVLLLNALESVLGKYSIPLHRIECWSCNPVEMGRNLSFGKNFYIGFAEHSEENGYFNDVKGEYTLALLVE